MITRYCEDPFQRVRDFLNPSGLLQRSNSVRGCLPYCSFWSGHCAPCTDIQIPSLSNPENSPQHYCFPTYLHHKLNLYPLFPSLLPVPTGGSSSTFLSQMPRMLQILLINTCMITGGNNDGKRVFQKHVGPYVSNRRSDTEVIKNMLKATTEIRMITNMSCTWFVHLG